MQISLSTGNTPVQGKISGADFTLPSFGDAETFDAKVIFSSGDTVHLKTADGTLIRARLEGGVALPAEGSEVTLTVEKQEGDTVLLRLGESVSAGRAPALPPALMATVQRLLAADLPTAQKVELFAKALAEFPALSAREPAVREAAALISGQPPAPATATAAPPQGGVGQMLDTLSALLSESATPATATTANATPPPSLGGQNSPLAQLFALFAPAAETAALPGGAPADAATAQAAVTTDAAAPPPTAPTAAIPGGTPQPTAPQTAVIAPNPDTPGAGTPVATQTSAPTPAAPPSTAPAAPPPTTGEQSQPLQPEQRQQLLQVAQQIVTELYPSGESGAKAFGEFIEHLYARLDKSVQAGSESLHKSARELTVRLEFLKEAIERSSLPQREELLIQTNRILDQTEALRESRLLALQIPVQLPDGKNTAELYVYRRKGGGKKLDPQNATILLALNTEHLGRLEALIRTRGKELTLKLEISRQEAVPFVREQSNQLYKLVSQAGFKLSSAVVEPLKREPAAPHNAHQVLEEFQQGFSSRFDFTI